MNLESIKNYFQMLVHNENVFYILIVLSVINIIGYYNTNNSPAFMLFILIGLGLRYLTKNKVYILLSTILITNFVVSLKGKPL